jgi:predicted nucleotide-binding protein (sugar kinase/HSP70/actin superfamily)
MDQAIHEPYRAYKPRPFLKEERADTTLLFGGLQRHAERFLQGAMENLGYKVEVLPVATKEDLLTGREVADIGQCCPTSFTTGNLANFLRNKARTMGKEAVAKKYAYMTAGSCGACRFGQYHQSYELALRNTGMEQFRMFLMAQDVSQSENEGGGLDLNPAFMMGAVWSVAIADVVQDLEYQIRPYEVNAGDTNRVIAECVQLVYEAFRDSTLKARGWDALLWYLTTRRFVNVLKKVHAKLGAIEVDRLRVKPLVKITGEFYLQTVEGEPNYNMHSWLESENAQVYPAATTIWLDYLLRLADQDFEDHFGITRNARLKSAAVKTMQGMIRRTYNQMRRALGYLPNEIPDQREIRALAKPYFHSRMNGGEGDMLIGKSLWIHHQKKAHMICELSPYSCMPNTMSIGAMAAVIGKHPDLLYAPLEIKGDAEIHALSRCQMILTEAKRRAQNEYEDALERTGLTTERARALLDQYPEMKRATYRLPHGGVAGTAARMVLHLAAKAAQ